MFSATTYTKKIVSDSTSLRRVSVPASVAASASAVASVVVTLLLVLSVFSGIAYAGAPEINTLDKEGVFGKFKHNGIAIRGYDTVAYFTEGKAVEGSANITTQWQGATWQFSSEEHKELFVAAPEKYAPQYGGYCAYGIANDYVVKIEPDQWQIVDDKLYLNYDARIQKAWSKNIAGYIKTADKKFEALLAAQ